MTAQRRADRALRDARHLHRSGELAAAEFAYRRLLTTAPDHPGALHGLGLLALQAGRADLAIGLIGQAARLAPDSAALHLDLGLALREQGHLEQARAAFHVAGLLDPDDPAPCAAMADMLARLGRFADADAAYQVAVGLAGARPTTERAALHHARGLVLRALAEDAQAAACLAEAVALAPGDVTLRNDLAGALLDLGAPVDAERELRLALAARPDHPRALNNLGVALQDQQRPQEALAAFQSAAQAAPDDPDIRNNFGVALRDVDRGAEALGCFETVLAAHPAHAPAHLNAASILLMQGEFARGWAEFEWRDRVPDAPPAPAFAQPRWRGEAREGRVLLAQAEMGLGDTIQFCRFVPRLGADVLFHVPGELARLMRTLPGQATIIEAAPVAFDAWCPLLSLPHLLGMTDDLGETPYLRADPIAVAAWRARLRALPGRRVGVCWAGGPAYAQDRRRSLPPARVASLARPGVSLVSLQKGAPIPHGVAMADWTGELADLADTAALIEALDLVVSVDTAVAHLAGALGKPVLLLDRFAGDWRWMRGRLDSPWYSSLTIVRQNAPGDWDSVLEAVAAALS